MMPISSWSCRFAFYITSLLSQFHVNKGIGLFANTINRFGGYTPATFYAVPSFPADRLLIVLVVIA